MQIAASGVHAVAKFENQTVVFRENRLGRVDEVFGPDVSEFFPRFDVKFESHAVAFGVHELRFRGCFAFFDAGVLYQRDNSRLR